MNDLSKTRIDLSKTRIDLPAPGKTISPTSADWIEEAYDEPFSLPLITARDVVGYKNPLLTQKARKPQAVNRHLTDLSAVFRWALASLASLASLAAPLLLPLR